jgi:hypothetical protein
MARGDLPALRTAAGGPGRGVGQSDARRRQIEKVEVQGERAVLEARDGRNAVTVQHLARIDAGWKVSARP